MSKISTKRNAQGVGIIGEGGLENEKNLNF